MRLALAALAVVTAAGPGWADQPYRVHKLAPATEAAWVAAVQDLRTDDGTTVLQTLRYAEEMRPAEFKVGDFVAGYNATTGEPRTILLAFWIGAKRESTDALGTQFEVQDKGGKVVVPRPKAYGQTAAEVIVLGRERLLRYIDKQYRERCVDVRSGAKLC